MDKDREILSFYFICATIINCVIMAWVLLYTVNAHADFIPYDDVGINQYVEAIYLAEGGESTRYPFGILSVSCEGYKECRRICYNTVRNNVGRFEKQSKYDNYLEFLASRYAPIGAENDPTGLNVNWIKNVRYFLNNGN